jgi:Reverse transcriptase (RNA-dependent DNA polymerase)
MKKCALRKDSSTAQSSVIRQVLAFAKLHKFYVGSIDVVAAFLKSGPLPRRVSVRPPREWAKPGCLWRLLRPAYGLVKSSRLWQLAIEKWIFARDFFLVPGASQVFVLRQSGTLIMLIARVVDDILVCGPPDKIQAFNKYNSRTYELSPLRTGSKVRFCGMDIVTENDGLTTIEVSQYLAACSNISLSAQMRKQQKDESPPDKRTAFRTLCGKLSYLGATEMPQARFAASHLKKRLAYLRISDSCEANDIMRNLRSLKAKILFCRPDQFGRNSYVVDNSCLIVSSLPSYFTRCLRIETSTYMNVKE